MEGDTPVGSFFCLDWPAPFTTGAVDVVLAAGGLASLPVKYLIAPYAPPASTTTASAQTAIHTAIERPSPRLCGGGVIVERTGARNGAAAGRAGGGAGRRPDAAVAGAGRPVGPAAEPFGTGPGLRAPSPPGFALPEAGAVAAPSPGGGGSSPAAFAPATAPAAAAPTAAAFAPRAAPGAAPPAVPFTSPAAAGAAPAAVAFVSLSAADSVPSPCALARSSVPA